MSSDQSFYVMFNAHHEALTFTLPEAKWGARWTEVLNTYESSDPPSEDKTGPEARRRTGIESAAWSTVLLRRID